MMAAAPPMSFATRALVFIIGSAAAVMAAAGRVFHHVISG
jgi:hypothetical protein